MAETLVVLKPRSQWRDGLTWDDLLREMDAALRYPGMPNVWWMPIQTRTEMLTTGVRAPLGIQVFGNNIAELERTAIAIERVVAGIPGTRSAFAERSSGGFFLDVDVRRDALVRHGLRAEDVLRVVETIDAGYLAVALRPVEAARTRSPATWRPSPRRPARRPWRPRSPWRSVRGRTPG